MPLPPPHGPAHGAMRVGGGGGVTRTGERAGQGGGHVPSRRHAIGPCCLGGVLPPCESSSPPAVVGHRDPARAQVQLQVHLRGMACGRHTTQARAQPCRRRHTTAHSRAQGRQCAAGLLCQPPLLRQPWPSPARRPPSCAAAPRTRLHLVHCIVEDFVHQVVQAAGPGAANVHARPLAHGVQPLEHLGGGMQVAHNWETREAHGLRAQVCGRFTWICSASYASARDVAVLVRARAPHVVLNAAA